MKFLKNKKKQRAKRISKLPTACFQISITLLLRPTRKIPRPTKTKRILNRMTRKITRVEA
jgi:hypothetical protein